MRAICSREIFTKKRRQQQNFDSDPKEAWHYNHVTFTPIAKNFMLYCRLIYMLSMLYVGLTIKVKVGIPESFKVGWYPHKITGSSQLKRNTVEPSSSNHPKCGDLVVANGRWSLTKIEPLPRKSPDTSTLGKRIYCMQFQVPTCAVPCCY